MRKPVGGSVFPITRVVASQMRDARPSNVSIRGGMTLLDYFAGHALQGLCVNERFVNEVRSYTKGDAIKAHQICAEAAYRIADAMIAERKK